MDGPKSSPFPPTTDVPLHRNPPLAPSQELAYRNKCISLKKRLSEIEVHNEQARKKIGTEKERIRKMRLLRAILLNQLKEIMETPGRKFSPEELEKLGIVNGTAEDDEQMENGRRPDGEALLDDSSDDSDEENPEPSDRPTRTRRQNNNYRGETIMNASTPAANPALYQQTSLPAIAPASSYSPAAAREPLLTSSFQTPASVITTALPVGSPQYGHQVPPQPFIQDSRFSQSSPSHAASAQPLHSSGSRAPIVSQSHSQPESNGFPRTNGVQLPQPVRPKPPYEQFCDHMRPQLEADHYPREQIQTRIDDEWRRLSTENRDLWDQRYNDQMVEYETEMDSWKRVQRRLAGEPTAVVSPGRPATGFQAINRAGPQG